MGYFTRLDVVLQDPRLRWPDGFAFAPDGSLYVTASALNQFIHKLIVTTSDIKEHASYQIFRLSPQP